MSPKIRTGAPLDWWQKLMPLARQMRSEPTLAEKKLWERLRNRQVGGYKFRRQHAIERFIVDFFCADRSLVVEVDGPIHEYITEHDTIRQAYLESRGLRVIRFENDQVLGELQSVLDVIYEALQASDDE